MNTPFVHKILCGAAAAVCSVTLLFGPAAARAGDGADAATVEQVRAALERSKRPPTGREASLVQPQGTSAVWFELAANGKVRAAGVDATSGSQLLDAQATALVRRARYAPFAAHAFDDATAHRFVAHYVFKRDTRPVVTVGPAVAIDP